MFTLLPPVTGRLEQETLWRPREGQACRPRIFRRSCSFHRSLRDGNSAKIAAALSKPVMMDIGEAAPDEIQRLASAFPKSRLFCTAVYYRNLHISTPFTDLPQCLSGNGLLKTFGSLEDICARFGSQQVFGSGAPYYDMGGAAASACSPPI